ncbi:hypothetical protein [Archangium sp.]|uniref:hypothetical protein n=1 Tax=Archangium sp. TaxID=1872627 RepID=UPI00286A4E3B|nr:hypothetical protein [Archangium sp.]
MEMKRWMLASCAVAATWMGCGKSEVDPELEITLTGKALREDGQPVANTLLSLSRSINSECVFSIFGGGNWKSMKTGADGSFSLEMLGADTQNGDLARCFFMRVPGQGSRSVEVEFLVKNATVQLPTLQEWSGAPTAALSGNGVSATFQDLATAQAGVTATHSLSVRKKGSYSIWRVWGIQSTTQLSEYVLEDVTDLEVAFFGSRKVENGGNPFTIRYDGNAATVPQRVGRVPVSRGASCVYTDTDAPTVCPLTDGNLGVSPSFKDNTREVSIQLAQPKVLRKAVLRDLDTFFTPRELVLEGSSDGTTWVPLANLLQGGGVTDFSELALNHPAPLSHVRIRSTGEDKSGITSLSEVSLFE